MGLWSTNAADPCSIRRPRTISIFSRLVLCSTLLLGVSFILKTRPHLLPSLPHLFPSYSSYTQPTTMSYQQERDIAELAVQRATLLTQKVFNEKA